MALMILSYMLMSNAGGTAIKYLNGINSIGDWPGPFISSWSMNEDEAVEIIMKIWYDAC